MLKLLINLLLHFFSGWYRKSQGKMSKIDLSRKKTVTVTRVTKPRLKTQVARGILFVISHQRLPSMQSADRRVLGEARRELFLISTGCVSKNLMLHKNAHQTKPTNGKWSFLLILQQQLSHDQNKVKKGNILK